MTEPMTDNLSPRRPQVSIRLYVPHDEQVTQALRQVSASCRWHYRTQSYPRRCHYTVIYSFPSRSMRLAVCTRLTVKESSLSDGQRVKFAANVFKIAAIQQTWPWLQADVAYGYK